MKKQLVDNTEMTEVLELSDECFKVVIQNGQGKCFRLIDAC